MLIVTKSYAPDFSLCERLNRSVMRYAAPSIEHHIVVPRSDLPLFNKLSGPRTRVMCDSDFLPRHFIPCWKNITINAKRPWPPIRGWIQQQVVKLAIIAEAQHDVVLTVDSDVEFIRPFSSDRFLSNKSVRFFCGDLNIDVHLPRHMKWHSVARELLGLPEGRPPYPDYISSAIPWHPRHVRTMLGQIEARYGREWQTTIGACLDFSECILYGVYVDEIAKVAETYADRDSLCASYWPHRPLDQANAVSFIEKVKATDISVMIPSKSGTSQDVREYIVSALRA